MEFRSRLQIKNKIWKRLITNKVPQFHSSKSNMRGARKTNMQQRDDPNYGPLGQVSHPLSVSAMSSLPSQPSHLHSV